MHSPPSHALSTKKMHKLLTPRTKISLNLNNPLTSSKTFTLSTVFSGAFMVKTTYIVSSFLKPLLLKESENVVLREIPAGIQGIFKRLETQPTLSKKPSPLLNEPHLNLHAQVAQFRQTYLKAGINAFHRLGNNKQAKRFEDLYEKECQSDDSQDKEGVTKQAISSMLALKSDIINTLAANINKQACGKELEGKKAAREALEHELKDYLNNQPWETITKSFSDDDKTYHSKLIPAGEMKLGKLDIFAKSYDNKGITSKSSTETNHAVNLWASEFSVETDTHRHNLFRGLRHGVLSPYGVKDKTARQDGALARAKEVVTAALYLQKDKLEHAIKGQTVELQLTSTSLLTPIDILNCTEKTQLQDQLKAWEQLSNEKPIALEVKDQQGKPVRINVNVEIAAFNFGVNQLALGRFKMGHKMSDKINTVALKKLLGNDLTNFEKHGGWVGKYLEKQPENKAQVILLATQLKKIIHTNLHHSDDGEPYKAAMRVALLTSAIGLTPCYNCKSGKDRTGMLDVEIKRELASNYKQTTENRIGLPDESGMKLMQHLMVASGNAEVQGYNTSVAGSKTLAQSKILKFIFGDLSISQRIGNDNVFKMAKGLSDYV
jgi:phosphatidylinositol-4,5-bisphosphate 4-phosphatase